MAGGGGGRGADWKSAGEGKHVGTGLQKPTKGDVTEAGPGH